MSYSSHTHAGATAAMVSLALPDGVMSFVWKVVSAVIIGLLTGLASKLGARLMERKPK